MIYGFIGTGTITAAMIDGMMASTLDVKKVLVSPRNAGTAEALSQRYGKVEIAGDNQAVADAADVLILAVRPQVAKDVLSSLRIPPQAKLISVIAATHHVDVASWTGRPESAIVRAIPLPFLARHEGVTAIFPGERTARNFFGALGEVVECMDQNEFDLMAAASSMMGTYFGLMEIVSGWLADKGMTNETARRYLTPLYSSLAHVATATPHASYCDLRQEFSTRGGLNEQLFRMFDVQGGSAALLKALDDVLARLRK
ncbi:pyrroline-5-carboxylate reductase [Pseudorhizobium flavum]|uniref:pyrroline-5-carboxylate reductase n=1 Tax=Pseudorhizobium flavum TaxID=1335061 RepID=UPI0024938152|nr:pyrroline-5-carboxylate reductase [Pseudorhizobium flavum]